MPFLYFRYDPTYILVLIGAMLSILASVKVKSTYARYSGVRSAGGVTGAQAAERILKTAGVYGVRIERVAGKLSDHYDPRTKTLRLSDDVYSSSSVAAVGVAAHECGHAIQHANGYAPLTIRGALVPVANFGSAIAWPLIILGLLFNSSTSYTLIMVGIFAFSLAVLFQIVTLPVEYNASRRALRLLDSSGILYGDELRGAKQVLSAAALTYVAGTAAAILQLFRILLLTGNKRKKS